MEQGQAEFSVLLVDDDAAMAEALADTLQHYGFRAEFRIEWASALHTLEPGDILASGTNHRGLHAFQDGDRIELEIDGLGRLAFKVSDALKRTWSRETRLERQEKGLDPVPPQLTGKYAPA